MEAPLSAAPRIQVEGLGKTFYARGQRVAALEGISFVVPDGEFWCLVGPSGCGKSTLLRILAGLEQQSCGQVRFRAGGGERPTSSMVFQEQSVFPWMTVWDNVAYGLRCRRLPVADVRERVEYYLAATGLQEFARAYPHQLSGGMKQRVSVARAFANDPDVLLMDEPFGALDEQTKALLQEELLRLWERSGKTVVFVTHSIDEALLLSDRILIISARPGRVKEIVPVDFPRPRTLTQVRHQPGFADLFTRVWESLRGEVSRAEEDPVGR